MFDNILGQSVPKKQLSSVLNSKRFTNAYIFSGPEGVGKKLMAEEFAKNLLGVELENSPDYEFIEPKSGENSIKIERIRKLIESMSITPYSDYKIFIINDAEKMTVPAQNSLLKTLEEPSSYGIIILITKNEQSLLQTIRSRCSQIKFSPLSQNDISSILKKHGIDSSIAGVASIVSKGYGSASMALDLCKDSSLMDLRVDCETFLKKTLIDVDKFEVMNTSNRLSKHSDNVSLFIELLKFYVRDSILYREGMDTSLLVNSDRAIFIIEMAKSLSLSQLGKLMDVVEDTEIKFNSHCSFNSTIQSMAIRMLEIKNIYDK